MLVCPTCCAIYRSDVAHCGRDGSRLESLESDPLLNKTLGRYTVESYIGSGAIGRVYLARHVDLSAEYAVKVLHGEHASDETLVRRFHREAEALGRLNHPNIVSVVDFGESEIGTPFLVMDLVRGPTLREVLAQSTKLDLKRARRITRDIASGLAEAHRLGFVHRDLKPANIVLRPIATGEHAMILDFGFVSFSEPTDGESLTRDDVGFGTPKYMAPEQIIGGRVGAEADVYGLGATLFEMVAGQAPHTGTDRQILAKKRSLPAPALVAPEDLSKLVADMLDRTPEHRPGALDVYHRLESVRSDLAPTANSTASPTLNELPTKRPPHAPRVAATGLGVVVAGLAAALIYGSTTSVFKPSAEEPPAIIPVTRTSTAGYIKTVPIRFIELRDCGRGKCSTLASYRTLYEAVELANDIYAPLGLQLAQASVERANTPALSGGAAVAGGTAFEELSPLFPGLVAERFDDSQDAASWLDYVGVCHAPPDELIVWVSTRPSSVPAPEVGRSVHANTKRLREEPNHLAVLLAEYFGITDADPRRIDSPRWRDVWTEDSNPIGLTERQKAEVQRWLAGEGVAAVTPTPFDCEATARSALGEVPDDAMWFNNGDATFSRARWRLRYSTYRAVVGDFDGDGRANIFWHRPGPLADPLWTIDKARALKTSIFRVHDAYEPDAGDFDGDGDDDVLWWAPDKPRATIWWVDGGLKDFATSRLDVSDGTRPIVGDFDADGRADILWWKADEIFTMAWGKGPREFEATIGGLKTNGSPQVGDFDGDGCADIYWYRPGPDVDEMWWGSRDRRFIVLTDQVQGYGTYVPVVLDLNGDGRDDLLFNARRSRRDPVWLGQSTRSFRGHWIAVPYDLEPVAGDFDGDGAGDIYWYASDLAEID